MAKKRKAAAKSEVTPTPPPEPASADYHFQGDPADGGALLTEPPFTEQYVPPVVAPPTPEETLRAAVARLLEDWSHFSDNKQHMQAAIENLRRAL